MTDSTKKLELEFKGLDTYCEIYLNNKKIADCNNMHRTYTFDVLEYVKSGVNTLKIKFLPPACKGMPKWSRILSSRGRFRTAECIQDVCSVHMAGIG